MWQLTSRNEAGEAICLKAFLIGRTSLLILESRVTGKLLLKSNVPPEWVVDLNF